MGIPELLQVVREMYAQKGVEVQQDEVIITSGASQGIELMSKTFLDPGDVVLVESPTFLGALQTFFTYESEVKEVAMDEDGIIPEDLKKRIEEKKPKFLYTIPTFQNPTGRTMTEARRREVYDICKNAGVMILEDDPYRDLRYHGTPVMPIKALDTEGIVVSLMSFSKIISPGLRVGAAIADPAIIGKFNVLKQGMDVHTSNLSQTIAATFVKHGHLTKHIPRICEMYRKKLDLMQQAITAYFPPDVTVTQPEGGLFLWATMPEGTDGLEVFQKAVEAKVAFVPGTHFYASGAHENTMRLNFSMASDQQIEEGIKRLAKVLKEI